MIFALIINNDILRFILMNQDSELNVPYSPTTSKIQRQE